MSAAPIADSGSSRVHRSQSTRNPSSGSHSYRPSTDQGNMATVARRDFEQVNLANAGSRRSNSRDRTANPQYPTRSDSLRTGSTSHNRSERRYASIDATSSSQAPTNGVASDHPTSSRAAASGSTQQRKRTYITCSTGIWVLGKTIGQGSMGKVKLAKNQETGEQVSRRPVRFLNVACVNHSI